MNNAISSVIATTVLLATGCAQPVAPTTAPQRQAAAALAKAASLDQCQMADTIENTCEKKDGKDICNIYVYRRPIPIVLPYTLDTPKGVKEFQIVWNLIDPTDRFSLKEGDGPIELKANATDFVDIGPVDAATESKASASGISNKYAMTFKAKKGTFKYSIQFRDKFDKVYTCDPNIVNGGV